MRLRVLGYKGLGFGVQLLEFREQHETDGGSQNRQSSCGCFGNTYVFVAVCFARLSES